MSGGWVDVWVWVASVGVGYGLVYGLGVTFINGMEFTGQYTLMTALSGIDFFLSFFESIVWRIICYRNVPCVLLYPNRHTTPRISLLCQVKL